MEYIVYVVAVFYIFSCGFFTAKVAKLKGYDTGSWLLAGIVFNIFALLASVGLPNKRG